MCLGVSSWRVFAPHFYAILRNWVDISLHNKIFQLQKKWFLKVEILNITKELNNDKIWQNVKWVSIKTCRQLENLVSNMEKWRGWYLIAIDMKCETKHVNGTFLAVRRQCFYWVCSKNKTQTETNIWIKIYTCSFILWIPKSIGLQWVEEHQDSWSLC